MTTSLKLSAIDVEIAVIVIVFYNCFNLQILQIVVNFAKFTCPQLRLVRRVPVFGNSETWKSIIAVAANVVNCKERLSIW